MDSLLLVLHLQLNFMCNVGIVKLTWHRNVAVKWWDSLDTEEGVKM